MPQKEKKNDNKYFYAVVLIAFGVVGFSVWQIFFTDPQVFQEPDQQLEQVPRINFTIFDSHQYQRLDFFERADDLFPEWKSVRERNPFNPNEKFEQDFMKWWEVFGFEFKIDEGDALLVRPEFISGQTTPELTLFEGRSYKIEWIDDNPVSEFKILNQGEEEVYSSDSGELNFEASEDTQFYSYVNQRDEIEQMGEITLFSEEEALMPDPEEAESADEGEEMAETDEESADASEEENGEEESDEEENGEEVGSEEGQEFDGVQYEIDEARSVLDAFYLEIEEEENSIIDEYGEEALDDLLDFYEELDDDLTDLTRRYEEGEESDEYFLQRLEGFEDNIEEEVNLLLN